MAKNKADKFTWQDGDLELVEEKKAEKPKGEKAPEKPKAK
jgi:hypothetical protein